MNEVVALIPARGGSKGISRKNLVQLGGFPLIQWSIEVAKQSEWISRVVVSTEDPEIAEVSRRLGAEVPFLREHELSADDVGVGAAVNREVDRLLQSGVSIDVLVVLFPSHPFRTPALLDDAIEIFFREGANVVSVSSEIVSPCDWWTVQAEQLCPVGRSLTGRVFSTLGLFSVSELRPSHGPTKFVSTLCSLDASGRRLDCSEYFTNAFLHCYPHPCDLRVLYNIEGAAFQVDIDTPEDLAEAESYIQSGAVSWTPGSESHLSGDLKIGSSREECSSSVDGPADGAHKSGSHLITVKVQQGSLSEQVTIPYENFESPSRFLSSLSHLPLNQQESITFAPTEEILSKLPTEDSSILFFDMNSQPSSGWYRGNHLVAREFFERGRIGFSNLREGICLSHESSDGIAITFQDSLHENEEIVVFLYSRHLQVVTDDLRVSVGQENLGGVKDSRNASYPIQLSVDRQKLSIFKVPDNWNCGLVFRFLPISAATPQLGFISPIHLPGLLYYDKLRASWINDVTGQIVYGRQAMPTLFKWSHCGVVVPRMGSGGNYWVPRNLS